MMLQTGSCRCFCFFFLLFTLYLSPMLAYFLKNCNIVYSDNVTAGVSVECKNGDLLSVPDDIPREVSSLTLENNDIQKVNRTDFYSLRNLTDLNLSYNQITHVDDGAFVHLVQVKVLNMNHNKLTTLTDSMFQGLSSLSILSLDGNNITSINPAALRSLPSLQELSLTSNQIHQMTDVITVLQLPRLHKLNISIYELGSFQSKDLPLNMSSELRELRVDSGSITKFSITTAVFPHLEEIDLLNCCNDSGWEWDIPDKDFLRNITRVYLRGHYLSYESIRNSLESLDSLVCLQLSAVNNWIDRGLLNIACKIPTLRALTLQDNNIDNIREKLSNCSQLTYLDLLGNDLTELSKDSIDQMNELSHLDLACNQLSKVPEAVNYLPMLRNLSLHHNGIQNLSCSDFLNLTRLTQLHLDANLISELKPCVFQHLNELKVLTMSGNCIWMFGDAFKIGLQKLEFLDFSHNQISVVARGDFTNLKSLKHLVLESRALYEWDSSAVEGLDELETLSLSFNFVDPKIISLLYLPSLKKLKSLKIQCNQLLFTTNISNFTSKNTPNLEALDLSKNKLKSLDFLAQVNLTRLSRLDLKQNELTVINVSVFSFLPALRSINMVYNPFTCDCFNADFQQWMQNNNQTQVVDAHRYTCGSPLAKKGTRFLDFDYHSCWVDTSFICFLSSTCVIVLTLLTSFTYHFLRLHLLYAYYLFLAFLHDAKERKKGSPQRYDAFISYNVHDELWVCTEMLPVLEGEQGWRLCLHHRDFLPGAPIIENITDAIYGSRKTICVISRHYLESEWCSREIQMASYRLFDEQKDVLILVFLEDIPAHQLSPYYHMRRLVKRHTYLSWSQAGQHPGLFWQNLRRALDTPHTDLALNE